MNHLVSGLCVLLFLVACTSSSVQVDDEKILADYREYDIESLQALMQNGELNSRELTEFYLDRIEAVDKNGPALNSIIEVNPDALDIARALDQERATSGPRGSMHGIPVVLKANIDTADQMDTTAGSLALAGHKAPQDSFMVARLRESGECHRRRAP